MKSSITAFMFAVNKFVQQQTHQQNNFALLLSKVVECGQPNATNTTK